MDFSVSTTPQHQDRPAGAIARTAFRPAFRTIAVDDPAVRKPHADAFHPNRTAWDARLPISAQKAALRLAAARRCLTVDILHQGLVLGLSSREMRDFADLVVRERDARMGPLNN